VELQLPHGWNEWDNSPIVLFHGTTASGAASILSAIDVAIGEPDKDFGRGFYTTTLRSQASEWAERKAITSRVEQLPAIVKLTLDRVALSGLNHLGFVRKGYDAVDFWRFVFHCRQEGSHIPDQESYYDVVYGPVAEIWFDPPHRSTFPRFDQISFHTVKAQTLLNDSMLCQKELIS
jgi:hypothetical protein